MAKAVAAGGESLKTELKGARELSRTLRQAGQDLSDLKEANAAAAKVVEGETRRRVPRDSGRLVGTIRSTGTKAAGMIRAGKKSVPYAGPIHWGWPARGIPANPFAADAAKATEAIWGRIYEDAVSKALDRIKGA